MSTQRTLGRLVGAVALGLASVAACAGAAPAGASAREAWTPDPEAEEAARRGGKAENADAGAAPDDAGPRCPYGSLEDPHRGFVRCLTPDERDAGWLPPPPQGDPPPPPPPDGADGGRAPAPAPLVEVGTPKFENGEVPRAEKNLGKASSEIAKCVADHGGLAGDAGSLKVQFLVRARARAEGVEVLAAKGVSAEASACVRKLLKNRAVGAPTADPVGVTVVIGLKAPR
jgi:hypothetical protein